MGKKKSVDPLVLKSENDLFIGIDPGTRTGFAVYCRLEKKLIDVQTVDIVIAMDRVLAWSKNRRVVVVLEDARRRGAVPGQAAARAQGAGSVKRDSAIWETFCAVHKIPMVATAPVKGMTKIDQAKFSQCTGWTQKTSNHARDAAMLVYGI
jgi:hypothetical protein